MPITQKKYMNEARTQELITKIKEACKPKPKIVTWTDGTDEEIVSLINALDSGEITTEEIGWDVGDERTVSLNSMIAGTYNVAHVAQNVTLVIADKSNYNGVGHYIIAFKDCIKEAEKMETYATNMNGWKDSKGRKCCDAIFDSMIPSTLKSIFKTISVTAAACGGTNSSDVNTQNGKMALLAEKEIYSSKICSTSDEYNSSEVHNQLEWYKTSSNAIKAINGQAVFWYTRSPSFYDTGSFAIANKNGSGVISGSPDNSLYFAPFLVI